MEIKAVLTNDDTLTKQLFEIMRKRFLEEEAKRKKEKEITKNIEITLKKILMTKKIDEVKNLDIVKELKKYYKNDNSIDIKDSYFDSKEFKEITYKKLLDIKKDYDRRLEILEQQKKLDLEREREIIREKEEMRIELEKKDKPLFSKKFLAAVVGIGIALKAEEKEKHIEDLKDIFKNKENIFTNPENEKKFKNFKDIFKNLLEPDKENKDKSFLEKSFDEFKKGLKDIQIKENSKFLDKETFLKNIGNKLLKMDYGNPEVDNKSILKIFDDLKNFEKNNLEKTVKNFKTKQFVYKLSGIDDGIQKEELPGIKLSRNKKLELSKTIDKGFPEIYASLDRNIRNIEKELDIDIKKKRKGQHLTIN